MSNTYQAHHQWATRPDEERYTSLPAMAEHFAAVRNASTQLGVSTRRLLAKPTEDNKGLLIEGVGGEYSPTNWAFGQVAELAGAPAAYLRTLPSPMAADCVNYGLQIVRRAEDAQLLLYKNGGPPMLRAATGVRYGRVWNEAIIEALMAKFGDGVTGDFCVPGTWGEALSEVTKDNTTLYAGDRDMWVFLADEKHKIEVPNRRNGSSGLMSRGFFCWNSEVGSASLGIATFLFDYVCGNRIVWGASDYKELRIRHSLSAPDRFIEEVAPALNRYAESSDRELLVSIEAAKKARIGDVSEFLARRFTKPQIQSFEAAHLEDEGRPIESRWDLVTAITAAARDVRYQADRIALERKAGEYLSA